MRPFDRCEHVLNSDARVYCRRYREERARRIRAQVQIDRLTLAVGILAIVLGATLTILGASMLTEWLASLGY